ncbi:hypothetical protein [Sedimentitalea todarodis]|uniref:Aspartate carbamoyltransferase catalytic subunit n=1 Tax=Sedimentitalea todarodis TaxID=1631240 RepID=A0ABU3VAB6_9RHOB|nr:hypothetical protein [Sedimentitalea todarodis]MDU9003111.1 hypothetical protein [Sedimentitalea todarodis]
MSELLTVSANETGVLRLFALDMRREQIRFLHEPGALEDILGVTGLDPQHVEIFPVSDLDDLGLPGYLIEGHAIPEDQIADSLAETTGHVLLVHSRAFGGRAASLTPAASLSPLGAYTVTPTNWTTQPQPAPDSARRRSGSPQSPRAARARSRAIGGSIFAMVMMLVAILVYVVLR